ncbi:CMRF35-like molecule 3 [Stegastes partitus]|uniref:CMRF35-like molecule 3 n=1 Tax=Stegastes partitus TaxID=144197 RepID=A0A9Y4TXZ6_9TELE|nr:PREDICTED: CMRF35-like molecule 3 [Stegastes partitus]
MILPDAGVYWCGDKSTHRTSTSRVLHTKVHLDVKNIPVLTRYPTIGNSFTHRCNYQEGTDVSAFPKFICKGEDPSKCQPLARSTLPVLNKRFSWTDDRKGSITIQLNKVTTGDKGTYWCGARTKAGSKLFFQKIILNVAPPTTTPSIIPSTSEHSTATSVPSTPSTTAMSQDTSWLTAVIAAVVCVVVLVLVVILVVVYKRFECSNTSTNGDGPDKEAFYDKIQDQHPTYSTVNHPTRVSEDPFYSTVKQH